MRHGPSWFARAASRVTQYCYHHTPTITGRGRIATWASKWYLVARLEGDLWVRIFDFRHLPEHMLFEGHRFEPLTTDLLDRLVQPGMTVFDVGASLGRYSLVAARAVGPTGRVEAFEPTAEILRRLRYNARLNGFKQIHGHAVAVHDTTAPVTLYQYQRITEINSIVGAQTDLYDDAPWTAIEVPAVTLDSFCASQQIAHVDVVKLDVEGAELAVLRGGRQLLAGPDAPLLVVEFFPAAMRRAGYEGADLLAALTELGYACAVIEQLGGEGWDTLNVLATKPGHAARFPALAGLDLPPLDLAPAQPA